jgi:ribonuclease G
MKKEIIINVNSAESRIAILEEEKLVEILVERPEKERTVGDIYLGRVRKVLNGISAAFVDIGWEQDGFLHFNDLASQFEVENAGEEKILNEQGQRKVNLHPGQEILVQITKEPIGGKGPRITSQISLPGRFVVLVPFEKTIGVSRKIADVKEKRRLKKLGHELKDDDFGLIIRTVAEGKDDETLKADISRLVTIWDKIYKKSNQQKAPARIYKEMSLASSVIRDLFSTDIELVVVDNKNLYDDIVQYLEDVSPNLVDRIEYYKDKLPIYDYFEIEAEISKCIRRKVWLQGGGYIIIEHTEAMTTVDVNSGRFVGKQNHEENSLKVNLRAAREIARQLRLRDIGGIIAIDFIDLTDTKNRKKVYDELKKELKDDRAKVDVAPISHFGLLLMTRQRIKPALLFTFKEQCAACHGTGMVSSKTTVVTELERWITRFIHHTGKRRLRLTVHPDLQKYLLEGGVKNRLNKLMFKHRVFINLRVDASLSPSTFKVQVGLKAEDITEKYL